MLVLIPTLLWGLPFPARKLALDELGTADLVFWMRALGAVTLGVIVLCRPVSAAALRRQIILPGLVLGGLVTAGTVLQTAGIEGSTASNAGFITSLFVVFTVLISAVVDRRTPSSAVVFATALAVVGLALLSLNGFEIAAGDLLTLLAAFVFGVHLVVLGRTVKEVDPLAIAFVQVAFSAILAVPLALPGGLDTAGALEVPGLLFLSGVLAGGIAIGVQALAQRAMTASRMAILLGGESIVAAIASALWLGEALTLRQWIGGLLLLAAMAVSEIATSRAALNAPRNTLAPEPAAGHIAP